MGTARARHILVYNQEECDKLKDQIEGGAEFEEVAKEHSTCPSGKSGGDLESSVPVKWYLSLTKWFLAKKLEKSTVLSKQILDTTLSRLQIVTIKGSRKVYH